MATLDLKKRKPGEVYVWGQNMRGQLGTGEIAKGSIAPIHLETLNKKKIVCVAAGYNFCAAVSGESHILRRAFSSLYLNELHVVVNIALVPKIATMR